MRQLISTSGKSKCRVTYVMKHPCGAMVIYLIAKLEYTVWGSLALFRVVIPIKMYGAAVFDGVFSASLSHECEEVKAH